LEEQTEPRFQIIVAEDGRSREMAELMAAVRDRHPRLLHLTQEHQGWRKPRSLNRAVAAAGADRLIFLDGDCVPHRRLMENHLRYAEAKTACVGRRVQLGPRFSQWLRGRPERVRFLHHQLAYLALAPALLLDGARNYEVGLVSPLLQAIHGRQPRFILGCNFSCAKDDLLAINGFNEDYVHPGVGEDTDLEWRFERAGIRLRSVRFLAPVFHLDHPSAWTESAENQHILQMTRRRNEVYCHNGIRKIGA
jgi:cellulose synthase/poly-beta-1,6-N-acetylglucosamine synthase-like glycosyltransferase